MADDRDRALRRLARLKMRTIRDGCGVPAVKADMLARRRKASAKDGDDVTLSRFVKLPGAHRAKPRQLCLDTQHPALLGGHSLFRARRLVKPSDVGSLLVSGHSNMKIGRDVRKGRLRGYWIYTLSLEERARRAPGHATIGLVATATTCRGRSGSTTPTPRSCRN